MSPGVRIRTERLTLREFVPADEAAVHSYASDPTVTRFMVWGPNTVEDTRAFIASAAATSSLHPRLDFDLAVVNTDTEKLIGGAALRIADNDHRVGEIGYILHRGDWSQGYATEVAAALLRFGFDGLGLQRIVATCDPDNRASTRVLQKAGLQFHQRIPAHLQVRGTWRDSMVFGCASTSAGGNTTTGLPGSPGTSGSKGTNGQQG